MSIVVEDYHKLYGTTVAVAGLSFRVEPGEILGLVGPNGAGKTTTLRALAGILTPTRGRLLLAGYDIVQEPVLAKSHLAYIPDDPALFDRLTVWEHFRFSAAVYRLYDWQPRAEALLQRLELVEHREKLGSELSRGMRQKVAIGCGYLHAPRVLMLDEPLTGLDPRGIRTMKDLIREAAATQTAVMLSSHLLSLCEDLCTAILILHRGQLVRHAKLSELRQEAAAAGRQETLEDLFFRLTESGPASPTPTEPTPASTPSSTPDEPGSQP